MRIGDWLIEKRHICFITYHTEQFNVAVIFLDLCLGSAGSSLCDETVYPYVRFSLVPESHWLITNITRPILFESPLIHYSSIRSMMCSFGYGSVK